MFLQIIVLLVLIVVSGGSFFIGIHMALLGAGFRDTTLKVVGIVVMGFGALALYAACHFAPFKIVMV